jgi:RecJ-like exonuclease
MFTCFKCKGFGRQVAQMIGDVGRCLDCAGTGRTDKNMIACDRCLATGWVRTPFAVIECPKCKNTGAVEVPPV